MVISPRRTRGFTLVELLVVIAIIGVLVALLLPAVQAAREAARRSSCSNNLKQIGIALQNYHDTHNRLPPESIWAFGTPGSWQARNYSWIALSLPFMEQAPLHAQINFSLPLWNQVTNTNQPIRAVTIPVLLCPSDRRVGDDSNAYHGMSQTNYAGAEGYDWWNRRANPLGGVFTFESSIKLAEVLDGTSNTIAVGEVTSRGFQNGPHWTGGTGIPRMHDSVFHPALVSTVFSDSQGTSNTATGGYPAPDSSGGGWASWTWWRANPYAYKPTYLACWGINSDWPGPNSLHPGGAQFVMCDGSVRFVPEKVEFLARNPDDPFQMGVWMRMNTHAGQVPVQLP